MFSIFVCKFILVLFIRFEENIDIIHKIAFREVIYSSN